MLTARRQAIGGAGTCTPLDCGLVGCSSPLSPRTVEYPYQSGARLGDGWDYLTNTRVYSQCINFGATATDSYQQANLNYTRSIDDETMSVALNFNSSAHAGGSIGVFSGSASGSLGIDSSYKFTSKDDLIVAHASVVNGAVYVAAQAPPGDKQMQPTSDKIAGVRLSESALKLLKGSGANLEAFRAACGDGFVASIGTGADLYILYHFTHLDTDTRVKVTSSFSAGGGVGGMFNAGGSASSSIDFKDLVSQDKLGIYYVQNGGKIGGLPAKVEDVAARVSALPGEAFEHGRPLYLIVVPYTELNNWPLSFATRPVADLRTSIIRYLQRLQTIFFELQSVIADFRQHHADLKDYAYLHDRIHGLRGVDYAQLNQSLLDEINAMEGYVQLLDIACHQQPASDIACKKATRAVAKENLKFNDFQFSVKLPVPTNALPKDLMDRLVNKSGAVDQRKYEYSLQLYNHWIDRVSSVRCAIFVECLNSQARTDAYKLVTDTF
jgi:hypothetical protein